MSTEKFDYGEEDKKVVVRSHPFQEKQFSIDSEDMPTILRMLRSKIYSDKVLAVIREYSTNAVDAHIQSGKRDVPIHVTLPTKIDPQFIVRDYGDSLTEEEMWNMYIYFGKSTKRDDREQTGTLGIGGKAAFAYRDNFTIIRYRDGRKSTYLAQIDESDQGKLMKIVEEDTSEKDGIEIIVDVFQKDVNSFRTKSLKLFRHFAVCPKLYNLDDDEDVIENVYFLSGDGWRIREPSLIKTNYGYTYYESIRGQMIAIMGNIPYSVDSSLVETEDSHLGILMDMGTLYVDFPNGTIDFELSREGLEYNARTQKNILIRLERVITDIIAKVSELFNECDNLWDAKCKYKALSSSIDSRLFSIISPQVRWRNIDTLSREFTKHVSNSPDTYNVIIREYTESDEGRLKTRNVQSFRASSTTCLAVNGEDSPQHIASKVRTLFAERDLGSVHVFIFHDAQEYKEYKKDFHFDVMGSDNIIDLDTVERTKRSYPSNSTSLKSTESNSRAHISAFTLNSGYKSSLAACWSNSEINGTPGVYVPIYRMDVATEDKKSCTYSVYSLSTLLSDLLLVEDNLVIYGVRCKDITKLDDKWKHLETYIKELIESFCKDKKILTSVSERLAYDSNEDRLHLETVSSNQKFITLFIEKLDKTNVVRQLFECVSKINESVSKHGSSSVYYSVIKWSDTFLNTNYLPSFDFHKLSEKRKEILRMYPLLNWVTQSGYSYYWSDELYDHLVKYVYQTDIYYKEHGSSIHSHT